VKFTVALALAVACLCVRAAQPPSPGKSGTLKIGWFADARYYWALEAGGSIYECEVIGKTTTGKPADGERGSLRLRWEVDRVNDWSVSRPGATQGGRVEAVAVCDVVPAALDHPEDSLVGLADCGK